MTKTKRLKYLEHLKIKYIIAKIKTLHQQILSIKESTLGIEVDRNPYQMLKDWALDVLYIGTLCTLTVSALFGWFGIGKSLAMIIGLGVLPTLIIEFRKSLKGDS